MIKNNKEFITYSSIIVFGYLLVAFTANIQAQEDISSDSAESEEESSAPKKMSSLEKCMMNAESNKDKKQCIEDDMSSVEEFIEDEGLEVIEG